MRGHLFSTGRLCAAQVMRAPLLNAGSRSGFLIMFVMWLALGGASILL